DPEGDALVRIPPAPGAHCGGGDGPARPVRHALEEGNERAGAGGGPGQLRLARLANPEGERRGRRGLRDSPKGLNSPGCRGTMLPCQPPLGPGALLTAPAVLPFPTSDG